ncbi:MAG: hypothetical protein EZS28_007016 [Streblomastix strix]|uniref:Uncharacterized protein n=1 Tax=Streblomastix strix TaxID=222440 RepID=A0A5J4WSD5_9EUKA|nr:MAG: hypothetical protein EZS28_007016 [Streblomastix strix]
MGLIGAAFRPHSIGSQIIIMVPTDFLRKQSSWLAATSKYNTSIVERFFQHLAIDILKPRLQFHAQQRGIYNTC